MSAENPVSDVLVKFLNESRELKKQTIISMISTLTKDNNTWLGEALRDPKVLQVYLNNFNPTSENIMNDVRSVLGMIENDIRTQIDNLLEALEK